MPILFFRWFPVLFLVSFGLSVAAADVLVITDSCLPVQAVSDARGIELDLPARIEAELSAGLPADPHHAAEIARQRLRDKALRQHLRQAYQGIADAQNLNIARIPAVIVDRRYVIYGESDVSRAVARIDAYRNARP
jgi:integrating conjugative element protein (TIGR03757 family)